MALDGLWAVICAGAVVAAGPTNPPAAPAGENRDSAIATNLAVQTALQQAREQLLHNDYRSAVYTLESQLPYINGNRTYLRELQNAYHGYIRELRLSKQYPEAARYLDRLRILDRGAPLDSTLTGTPSAPPPTVKAAVPAPTVRLKSEDDPFTTGSKQPPTPASVQSLLARAERAFADHNYPEARMLYEQVHEADHTATDSCRERWAYCKLHYVCQELKQSPSGTLPWSQLEQEVRSAIELAPKIDFGQQLLVELERRRGNGSTSALRQSGRNADGWCVTESANFRVFHNQDAQYVAKVAETAERVRTAMLQKWFAGVDDPWTPKCDLYLHATTADYEKATGQHNSPGHSFMRIENSRLVVRRIDLHCDDATMLTAVLPHETTHVVLAGAFGGQLVPRWADEGVAVLTEPAEMIERHRRNLVRCRQDNHLLPLADLLKMEDYPQPQYISAFYAESVTLVEFLTAQHGPQEFTLFLHDGLRYGYEKSLQRHYGFRNVAELEQRWGLYAFRDPAHLIDGVAQRSH
jgi:tetratricopeptide (TPR) repeat protein